MMMLTTDKWLVILSETCKRFRCRFHVEYLMASRYYDNAEITVANLSIRMSEIGYAIIAVNKHIERVVFHIE